MERMQAWVNKFQELSAAGQAEELRRLQKEFYRPCTSPMLRFTPDLGQVPDVMDLDAESADAGTAAKVNELIQFIRTRFGKRCAVAAKAIMSGCFTGAEIGAKMGIARQSADEHLEKIQSPAVRRKAIQLGLVTRASFIDSMKKVKATRKAGKKTVTRRKVARKKATPKTVGRSRRRSATRAA